MEIHEIQIPNPVLDFLPPKKTLRQSKQSTRIVPALIQSTDFTGAVWSLHVDRHVPSDTGCSINISYMECNPYQSSGALVQGDGTKSKKMASV